MGNIELLKKTKEQIILFPEKHKQSSWIKFPDEAWANYDYNACHTTLCTAGHAAVLAGAEIPTLGKLDTDGWYLDQEGKIDDRGTHVSDWASDKLDLTDLEYNYIFLCFNNEIAIKRVDHVIQLWEEGKTLDDVSEDERVPWNEDEES